MKAAKRVGLAFVFAALGLLGSASSLYAAVALHADGWNPGLCSYRVPADSNWYLKDANIPGGSNSFVVTYDIAPGEAVFHAYGLLTGAGQASSLLDSDSATTPAGDVVGPTRTFNVLQDGMLVTNGAPVDTGTYNNAACRPTEPTKETKE